MSGLLPDVIREAIQSRTLYAASESFGVVPLVLVIVLLLEAEALRVMHRGRAHTAALEAIAIPLLVAVGLTVVLRVTELLP